jgi:hypothetical protein
MRRPSLSNKKSSVWMRTRGPQLKIGHLTFGIFLRVDLRIRRQNAPGVKAERQRAAKAALDARSVLLYSELATRRKIHLRTSVKSGILWTPFVAHCNVDLRPRLPSAF